MRELPFTLGCGLAIICLLLPAAWHIRSKNSGTLLYLTWSLTGNLIYFVNAIVWAENIDNPAPIWCDICEPPNPASISRTQLTLKKHLNSSLVFRLAFHALLYAFNADSTPYHV